MGFLPVVREHVSHKIFERKAKFSLYVCNGKLVLSFCIISCFVWPSHMVPIGLLNCVWTLERWERLRRNGSFVLGEPMYFEVSAAYISEDERIFVDSCYATVSTDPKSIPQHDVIYNYG